MSTEASIKSSEGGEAPLYRKPRADVFTFLLVIALLALILASTVLWFVMRDYKYDFKGGPTPVSPPVGQMRMRPRTMPNVMPFMASEPSQLA